MDMFKRLTAKGWLKGIDDPVQSLIVAALVSFGFLLGFALANGLHRLGLAGIAPLLGSAIGAAIGAAITLYFAERRSLKAAREARVAKARVLASDLITISVNLRGICKQIDKRHIDATTFSCLWILERAFSFSRQIVQSCIDLDFYVESGEIAQEFAHAERLVLDMQKLSYAELKADLENRDRDAGDIFKKEFERVAIAAEKVRAQIRKIVF